jgi:L-rhamnose isomerase
MQVLCCDWAVEVRAGVWEARGAKPEQPRQLRAFQRDVHLMRRISINLPVTISLLLLYMLFKTLYATILCELYRLNYLIKCVLYCEVIKVGKQLDKFNNFV